MTALGRRATTGALLGGAGGALLGAVVGSATTPQEPRGTQLCRYQDRYGRIYTAPCDDRYYNGDY
nr:hypothetical protein [Mesorhizobium ciceri]